MKNLIDGEYYLLYGIGEDPRRRFMHIFKWHADAPQDLFTHHAWFMNLEHYPEGDGDGTNESCLSFRVWESGPQVFSFTSPIEEIEGKDYMIFELTNDEVNAHVIVDIL